MLFKKPHAEIIKALRSLLKILSLVFLCAITMDSFAAQAVWHFTPADVNVLHSQPADHRIHYGKDPLQFADLRLPKGKGPYPVAIIIHGGCWMSKFADLQNTAVLADALRDLGIATWNIEYRPEDYVGGGWPGTLTDVGQAADFLKKIAPQYSLDLSRVVVIGHSAGGHLALWLAARHRLPKSSSLYVQKPLPVRGVIALGGVPDLKAFREQGAKICGQDVIGKLLGATPEEIEKHYQEASPAALLPLGVLQILIYGTEDRAVPIAFGNTYLQAAKKQGDQVKLITIKGAAHHEYNVPNSISWPEVKSAVLSFLL